MYTAVSGYSSAYIAKDQGFFEKRGLDVDLILAPSTPITEPLIGQPTFSFGGQEIPTRANLGLLAESATAGDAVAAARARAVVPVQPRAEIRDGQSVMTIRADAGYSVVQDLRTAAR